jgi:hypothetical protein
MKLLHLTLAAVLLFSGCSGSLSGTHFAATEVEPGTGVCQFRGGDLSGSFSEDGLHFEASETLRWGSSEHPVIVQRHWTGRRLE